MYMSVIYVLYIKINSTLFLEITTYKYRYNYIQI